MMSRTSSDGGGAGAAKDQRFGPEVLFSRGSVSPPRLEYREILTVALVETFLVMLDCVAWS